MNLFDALTLAREFWSAVQSRDWPTALKALGKLLHAAGDLLGPSPAFAAGPDDDAALADLDALYADLSAYRANPPVTGADPSGIGPAEIILIVELAMKVLDWIRSRRQR